MMIRYSMTMGDRHLYLVTDELTDHVAGVESQLAPHFLITQPELFDEEVRAGLATCARRWRELNTPKLVLTMQNQPRKPLINDLGELCID